MANLSFNPEGYTQMKRILDSLRDGPTKNVARAYEICLEQATQNNVPDLIVSLNNGMEGAQNFVKMFNDLLERGDEFTENYGKILRGQGFDV